MEEMKNLTIIVLEDHTARRMTNKTGEQFSQCFTKCVSLTEEKLVTVSSFLEDKIAKLKNGNTFKLFKATEHPMYGIQLDKRSIIMDAVIQLSNNSKQIIQSFQNPDILTNTGELLKVPLYSRVSVQGTINAFSKDISTDHVRLLEMVVSMKKGEVTVQLWGTDIVARLPDVDINSEVVIKSVEIKNVKPLKLASTTSTTIKHLRNQEQMEVQGKTESINLKEQMIEIENNIYRCDAALLTNMFPNEVFVPTKVKATVEGGRILQITRSEGEDEDEDKDEDDEESLQ